jgi:hypothetical protein
MALLASAALATGHDRWDRIQARLTPSFAAVWEQLASQLEEQVDRGTLQRARLSSAVEVSLKDAIHQLRQEVGADTRKAIQRQLAAGLYAQLADFRHADRQVLWGQSWTRPVDGSAYYLYEHLVGQIRQQGNYLIGGFTNFFAINPWSTWETLSTFCMVLGVDYSPRQAVLLDLCLRTVRALHFWMPCDRIVLCAERPGPPTVDERRRLHGPGLLCAYRDGWGRGGVAGHSPAGELPRSAVEGMCPPFLPPSSGASRFSLKYGAQTAHRNELRGTHDTSRLARDLSDALRVAKISEDKWPMTPVR